MGQRQHRLALDLGITVRHRDGSFLVCAGVPVDLEVIDQRLVQTAKAVARIAGNVFDAEALDDIGHVVRPTAVLDDRQFARVASISWRWSVRSWRAGLSRSLRNGLR